MTTTQKKLSNYNKAKDYIVFKEEYIKKILNNRKSITIRDINTKLRKGELKFISDGNRIYGVIKITKLETKKISDLTDEYAIKDGFKSKYSMLIHLVKHYPELTENNMFLIIHFFVKRIFKYPVQIELARIFNFKDPYLELNKIYRNIESKKIKNQLNIILEKIKKYKFLTKREIIFIEKLLKTLNNKNM